METFNSVLPESSFSDGHFFFKQWPKSADIIIINVANIIHGRLNRRELSAFSGLPACTPSVIIFANYYKPVIDNSHVQVFAVTIT